MKSLDDFTRDERQVADAKAFMHNCSQGHRPTLHNECWDCNIIVLLVVIDMQDEAGNDIASMARGLLGEKYVGLA